MIAAWMLYCTALGLLLVCAALPFERFVQQRGGAARRVWALALVGTILLPAAAVLVKDAPPAIEWRGELKVMSPTAGVVMDGVETLAPLDRALAVTWAVASAGLPWDDRFERSK